MILGHQAILSAREGRDVNLEEAAHNWYTRYHLPAILLLRQNLTRGEDPMQAYFAFMQHKWNMSRKAKHEVPLEEALLDWLMKQANTGTLGAVDPASVATWWSERKPVATALEPQPIESEELEPLLSTGEKALVRLPQPELEQKMPQILEQGRQEE